MNIQNYSDDYLTAAARMCYIDKIPQQEVAKLLNISQAKVSRLLTLARKRGIVQISVKEYQPRNLELENALLKKFKLQNVIVVKLLNNTKGMDLAKEVGYFGSKFLLEKFKLGMKVGLAGGRTIMNVINSLPEDKIPAMQVVQLMGNVLPSPAPSDASELGRKLAGKNGSFMALNAPVFVKDAAFKQHLLEHEHIKSVIDFHSQTDIALVGVGTPQNSIYTSHNAISKNDTEKLLAEGVCAEICGHFFDKDGNECQTAFKDRVISISIDDLKKIPEVFAVVSGADRVEAVRAVLKGKLVNSLLIDQNIAEKLLNGE